MQRLRIKKTYLIFWSMDTTLFQKCMNDLEFLRLRHPSIHVNLCGGNTIVKNIQRSKKDRLGKILYLCPCSLVRFSLELAPLETFYETIFAFLSIIFQYFNKIKAHSGCDKNYVKKTKKHTQIM
jgi:hypothetical protein